MSDQVRLSVIVCTYTLRRQDILKQCIASILAQLREDDELILVVDHNEPMLTAVRRSFPTVRVVGNRFTKGLSGARNTGALEAGGHILAYIDDDAVPRPGWLDAMRSGFLEDSISGLAGWIEPRWESAPPKWWPPSFNWVVGCSYSGLPGAGGEVRNPIGAAMSIRRDDVIANGGFSSSIGRIGGKPTGCEETELCIRIRTRAPGQRFVHAPTAVVDHLVPSERGRFRYFMVRCYYEGISKAYVTRLAGSKDSLSSERTYVASVLPREFFGGLRNGHHGLLKGLAIFAGLLSTTTGYLIGMYRFVLRPIRREGGFA